MSVVIATYQPGDGFDRVIASLDSQTLPQDEFETIVVDDGSPDDTVARLQAHAATRPNMRVERIENSGWPSRPRNLGTGLARGEYVFFMDHDDSLYPDALRRMVEFAAETGADLLSPKESKTSDAWWGLPALADGNVPNAVVDGGIDRLLPMVPHKLYRRAFLLDNGITFPEGRRQLWEDIYLNVAAWRHAERVAVLADTPAYLWHSSATNNSKTYGPRSEEFWDRLDDLFAFIDGTLDGDASVVARRAAMLHQYRNRVLVRLSRNLRRASPEESAMAMRRAQAIQQQYVPEAWHVLLPKQDRARAILLRAGRPDLLAALWTADADTSARVTATSLAWRDGRLHLALTAHWGDKAGRPIGLEPDGERLLRPLPPEVRAALPDEVVDLSDTLDRFRLDIGVRDRPESVTWQLRVDQESRWGRLDDGRATPELSATAVLDPASAAAGSPLGSSVFDLVDQLQWDGATRSGLIGYSGRPASAVRQGGTAVAYRSKEKALSLDTSAVLRNVIADGGIAEGRVPAEHRVLALPLPRIVVFGSSVLPATAKLTRPEGEGPDVVLDGSLVAEPAGAHLELRPTGPLPAGRFTLSVRLGTGSFLGTKPVRVVRGALTVLTASEAAVQPHPAERVLPVPVVRGLQAVRRRLGR